MFLEIKLLHHKIQKSYKNPYIKQFRWLNCNFGHDDTKEVL